MTLTIRSGDLFSTELKQRTKVSGKISCGSRSTMSKVRLLHRLSLRHSAVVCSSLMSFACAFHSEAAPGDIVQPSEKTARAETPMQSPPEVTFQTVSRGSRTGVRDARQLVVRGRAEWIELWAQHVSVDVNPAPPPPINFATELIVAVFLGEKPTGGYDLAISRVLRSDDSVVVYFREISPVPGAIVTQSLTRPFHIVRINTDVHAVVTFRRES
jgi:hypothetical protein